jgi:hypothetical protein
MALLLARVVDAAFTELAEVVAAAKSLAGTFDHDDVNCLLIVGPLHRRAKLSRCLIVDRIEALGPVEQQSSDARIGCIRFDAQGAEGGHGGSWY